LQADPHELHDLSTAPQHHNVLEELRDRLTKWQKDVGDPLLNH
jgi:hypothetical protein